MLAKIVDIMWHNYTTMSSQLSFQHRDWPPNNVKIILDAIEYHAYR